MGCLNLGLNRLFCVTLCDKDRRESQCLFFFVFFFLHGGIETAQSSRFPFLTYCTDIKPVRSIHIQDHFVKALILVLVKNRVTCAQDPCSHRLKLL
jgi:cytochrome bd-type quinol oxidase subunit 2